MDDAEKKRIAEELWSSVKNLEAIFHNFGQRMNNIKTDINKLAEKIDALLKEGPQLFEAKGENED